jgi:hypothetical protein
MEPDSNQSARRLAIDSSRPTCTPCSHRRQVASGSATRSEAFSFLDKGRVTHYEGETGSVYGFSQDRDGIVWACTSSGLWRFDYSRWQHIGVEWNAPAGRVTQVGFDSDGILWALVGGFDAPKDLIYLISGTGHFKTAGSNLSGDGFTWEPDRTVLTAPVAPRVSGSGEGSDERLSAYPVTKKP